MNEKQFVALNRGISVGKVRFEQRLEKGEIIQVTFLEMGVSEKEKSRTKASWRADPNVFKKRAQCVQEKSPLC